MLQLDEAVFCAGQIALVPCTMQLLRAGPGSQAQLCYSHMEKVLRAMSASLTLGHTLQAHCYVTDLTHIPAVRKVWHDMIQSSQDQVSMIRRTMMWGNVKLGDISPLVLIDLFNKYSPSSE